MSLLSLLVLVASTTSVRADSIPLVSGLKPTLKLAIESALLTDDDKEATDVSGIACMPAVDGSRKCLVINDEDRSGRLAILRDGSLAGGAKIPLIDKHTPETALGTAPTGLGCSGGNASFKDLDGEAVTYAAPFFYVFGSHGCSRGKAKFRLSSFIVARVRADDSGKVADGDGCPVSAGSPQVETTFRLSDVLTRGAFGKFFGKDLDEKTKGLNLEGAVVVGSILYVGLRSPVLNDETGITAGIARVSICDLFAAGNQPLPGGEDPMLRIPLGSDLGIRDLAALPDGRLLILSGPSQNQEAPYGLFVVDPKLPSKPTYLATLEDVTEEGTRVKAEAVLLLDQSPDTLRIVVMFDGAPSGGPREYLVPLKK